MSQNGKGARSSVSKDDIQKKPLKGKSTSGQSGKYSSSYLKPGDGSGKSVGGKSVKNSSLNVHHYASKDEAYSWHGDSFGMAQISTSSYHEKNYCTGHCKLFQTHLCVILRSNIDCTSIATF